MTYKEDITVAEMIELLRKMPHDANVAMEYEGYYEPVGGINKPYVDEGAVVICSIFAAPY